MVDKLTDAASMFWQSLDEHEKRMLVYVVAYTLVTLYSGLAALSRERRETRMRAEIVAELRSGAAST
jgi:hypothetical protein